ncbi:aspartate/glutamate racemase family protein [Legionella cardiaca]|uniref:Aspartate/glutamate racemase family protein n=1 Tax=Legionella cardiaca TaxID=1071983 RepID=A0ABY8AST9_9GAMM|nr:aspartate/glutamate racemase family protein [Legionella cardiaca]WED42834.1 aspartate/glutamate racemase family protein [Legionella cardiaca]
MKTKKRIWYQSFVDPTEQKNYLKELQQCLDNYADEDFKFEVHGLTPPDKNLHPLTEFRCAAQTIKNAIQAEKEGYDAFVIGHFQEPGINEIKACIDIPVIGLGESTMLHACSLGHKIGLITINPIFIPWHENQINYYGLQERVTRVSAVEAQVQDFEQAFTNPIVYQRLLSAFTEQVKPVVAQGIEVIILAGGLPMLLLAREKNFTIDNAVVLNGIAVCAKVTEMTLRLKELTGQCISRRATYKKAGNDTIKEFLHILK